MCLAGRHENEQHLHRPRGGGDRQPAGGGRGRRSGLPRVYPLAQCWTRTNGLGNSHRRTEHIRPEHQQGGPPWQGTEPVDPARSPPAELPYMACKLPLWCHEAVAATEPKRGRRSPLPSGNIETMQRHSVGMPAGGCADLRRCGGPGYALAGVIKEVAPSCRRSRRGAERRGARRSSSRLPPLGVGTEPHRTRCGRKWPYQRG
jgi:hypothetical protein